MEIVGTSVKKSTREDKEKIKELMGQDAHMFDDLTPREMYRMLKTAEADIMLSGGRSQFIALKAGMPWLDINQERHYAYAGYHGMVELVREIDRTLSNNVWEQVRKAPPWEEEGAANWQSRAMDALDEEAQPLVPSEIAVEEETDPATVEANRRARMVCMCKSVPVGAIEDAVMAGYDTREAVSAITGASTGCGGCSPFVGRIIDDLPNYLQAAE